MWRFGSNKHNPLLNGKRCHYQQLVLPESQGSRTELHAVQYSGDGHLGHVLRPARKLWIALCCSVFLCWFFNQVFEYLESLDSYTEPWDTRMRDVECTGDDKIWRAAHPRLLYGNGEYKYLCHPRDVVWRYVRTFTTYEDDNSIDTQSIIIDGRARHAVTGTVPSVDRFSSAPGIITYVAFMFFHRCMHLLVLRNKSLWQNAPPTTRGAVSQGSLSTRTGDHDGNASETRGHIRAKEAS